MVLFMRVAPLVGGDDNYNVLLSIDQVASLRLSGNDYPMLVQCWVNVVDAGPTLNQHWVKVWSMPQAMRNISIFKQPDKHLI